MKERKASPASLDYLDFEVMEKPLGVGVLRKTSKSVPATPFPLVYPVSTLCWLCCVLSGDEQAVGITGWGGAANTFS